MKHITIEQLKREDIESLSMLQRQGEFTTHVTGNHRTPGSIRTSESHHVHSGGAHHYGAGSHHHAAGMTSHHNIGGVRGNSVHHYSE
jgi:hypothetical protein